MQMKLRNQYLGLVFRRIKSLYKSSVQRMNWDEILDIFIMKLHFLRAIKKKPFLLLYHLLLLLLLDFSCVVKISINAINQPISY